MKKGVDVWLDPEDIDKIDHLIKVGRAESRSGFIRDCVEAALKVLKL